MRLKKWKVKILVLNSQNKFNFAGETDVRDAMIEKANYLAQIGDKAGALATFDKGLKILLKMISTKNPEIQCFQKYDFTSLIQNLSS